MKLYKYSKIIPQKFEYCMYILKYFGNAFLSAYLELLVFVSLTFLPQIELNDFFLLPHVFYKKIPHCPSSFQTTIVK